MTQHEKCSNNNSKKPPIHTHTDTNKTKHKTNRQLYITDDLFNICNKNNTLFLKTVKKKEKHNNSKVEKAFELLLQLVVSFRWYEMFIGTAAGQWQMINLMASFFKQKNRKLNTPLD